MAAGIGSQAVWSSIGESLWLDELHSTWCASGLLAEVAPKAAMGNQLPPYYWLLWAVGLVFGESEIVWRTPSLLAWIGLLLVSGWRLRKWQRQTGHSVVFAVLALAMIDRTQLFFATEARPYALLALLNFAAWLMLGRLCKAWPHSRQNASAGLAGQGSRKTAWAIVIEREFVWHWLSWLSLNAVAFWLQPTAVLSIGAQLVFLVGAQLAHNRHLATRGAVPPLWLIAISALILAAVMWPARYVLEPAWQHRMQWTSFAANLNLAQTLTVLPIGALIGPLLLSVAVQWSLKRIAQRRSVQRLGRMCDTAGTFSERVSSAPRLPTTELPTTECSSRSASREGWLWLCAWAIPWAIVWAATAAGIAPLLHQRYLFASAMPLLMWCAWWLARIEGGWWRASIFVAMLGCLTLQQGSLQMFITGRWPMVVRGEDWRGAAQWIGSKSPSNNDAPVLVFCASNLIEGGRTFNQYAEGKQSPWARDYLCLPLASVYRLPQQYRVLPLPNDPSAWASNVAEARALTSNSANAPVQEWLIARVSPTGFAWRVRRSGLSVDLSKNFGGVQVTRLRRETK